MPTAISRHLPELAEITPSELEVPQGLTTPLDAVPDQRWTRRPANWDAFQTRSYISLVGVYVREREVTKLVD